MPLDADAIPYTQAEDGMQSVQTALDAVTQHAVTIRDALHRINCWLGAHAMTQGELDDLHDAALSLGRAELAIEDAAAVMRSLNRARLP